MARDNSSGAGQVDDTQGAEVATITDQALLQQFAEMAVMIPADIGGGTEDILRKVLSATTWDELDEPWETSQVEDILGKRLKITSVVRRPSTLKGGLGVFLVIHLTDIRTGQEYVKTTGSVSVVGQIAAAYARGWMPILVEWCRAERPSQNGFYPQHLKVLDSFAAGQGDATA
jgi:hypothetical protein